MRYVTGEDSATVTNDIAAAGRILEGASLSEYQLCVSKLAEALPHAKSARAGIEMAILDAFCKMLGVPFYAYLGGTPLRIETDVTIPICTPQSARESAFRLSKLGFRQFKIKIGKDEQEDAARVVAVHEAAPGSSFILDANQGFTPPQAVAFVKGLRDRGLAIRAYEQPVDAADLEGMRFVTERSGVPVFADESAQTPADVIGIARHGAATGVNVKIQKSGIIGALEIKSICRAAGLELMFGCMLESKIGQSAACHIACGTNAFSIFDLDSDMLLAEQPVRGGATRSGSVLSVSETPGLGCQIVEAESIQYG